MQASSVTSADGAHGFRREMFLVGVLVVANLAFDVAILAAHVAVRQTQWNPIFEQYSVPVVFSPHQCSEAFVLGCFFAQVAALAIVTSLLSGSHLQRILLATLVLVAGLYLLAMVATLLPIRGFHLSAQTSSFGNHFGLRYAVLNWLFVVVMFYVIQVPFWVARMFLGLRLTNSAAATQVAPTRGQYSLLEVLGMMAFVAFPLGLAMAVLPLFDGTRFNLRIIVLSAFSIVFGFPYLWAVLGARRLSRGLITLLVASALLAISGALTYRSLVHLGAFVPPSYLWIAFASLQLGTLVVALGNGLPARAVGYRLVWTPPGKASES